MNRLSQTILPLALGLGLAGVLEAPAISFPRHGHHNRSRVIIISPSRDRYDDDYYYDDYRRGRHVDYGRRDRYDDDYYYGRRRRRRSSRYDCHGRSRHVGRRRRRRRYYSGERVNISPRIYRDSPSNVRVIRY